MLLCFFLACSKITPAEKTDRKRSEMLSQNTIGDCTGCHVQQTNHWKESRHAVSWRNDIFQKAYRVARFASWCADCHRPPHEGVDAQSQEGVTCQNCHERDGVVSTANPSPGWAPHPLQYDASLGTSEFCARCHQFQLPMEHPMYSEVAVQNTYQEWLDSGRSETCQNCHMDSFGHRFPGAHDAEFLQKSILVSQTEEGDTQNVSITIENVGHAVPTGDAFRRLEWRVCADPDCNTVSFRKTFAIVHQGPKWHVRSDSRLFPNQVQQFSYPKTDYEQSLIYHYEDPMLGNPKQVLLYSRSSP